MSTPFIVEACKTPEQEDYVLQLSATESGTDTITLKACLTLVTETWLHTCVCQSSPVPEVAIYFCSCDSQGHVIDELGTAATNEDGIATFPWTLNHAGDYWFVAQFFSSGHECHGHPDNCGC